MARTRGNLQQEAALGRLLSELRKTRGYADIRYKTSVTPVKLMVRLDTPNFPIISIGRRGGFELPDIRSYPQINGATDSLRYPGETAFDACLFGDKHVARQGSGAADSSPLNGVPWESE